MSRNEYRARWTALLLSGLLILLVVATVLVFVSGKYDPPAAITAAGRAIDHQFDLTLGVTAVVFVLSQLVLAFVVFRYQDHGQKVQFFRSNSTLQLLWTSLTAVLFVGLALLGGKAWAAGRMFTPGPDAVRIEVTENQFVFNFRYPGPDGKFGRLDPRQIDASLGNPLGLDSADPAARGVLLGLCKRRTKVFMARIVQYFARDTAGRKWDCNPEPVHRAGSSAYPSRCALHERPLRDANRGR